MLIVALDVDSFDDMKAIVSATAGEVQTYKVGLQLLTAAGPAVIEYLKNLDKTVFLDLKLHEIANSVASAITVAGRLGVEMVTVHASGGRAMMSAAVEAASAYSGMKVLALTVVSGLSDTDLSDVGIADGCDKQVLRLARLAQASGCHGVVASVREVETLRHELDARMIIVTPGIRPPGESQDDQYRVGTPAHAVAKGASFLIVGRPIVASDNPQYAARKINHQITTAMAQRHK